MIAVVWGGWGVAVMLSLNVFDVVCGDFWRFFCILVLFFDFV